MGQYDAFDQNACTLCGECFHQCPVLHLPLEDAKREIAGLIEGKRTGVVLKKCTSCLSCNLVCPQACNPAQLILEHWHALYREEGLPARAGYFIPHHRPNFRTYVQERLPKDEKALVRQWDDTSPCEEILYPGCNIITTPYLMMTSLFGGIPIRGSLDLCCGEMYYRSGQFEQVTQVAARLTEHFEKMGVKRMLIPCTAGRNLFTNILPRFGARFTFEIEHVLPWILRRLESGELEIRKKIDLTVTIQDSCHAKAFGDEYINLPRRLLHMLGAKVVEQEQCGNRMQCCGIGGGFSHASGYHPFSILAATGRVLNSARATGAQAVVTYCSGCMQQLAVGRLMLPFLWMEIYHILELVQIAIGETPKRRLTNRAMLLASGVVRNQFPKMVSRKRYTMDGLDAYHEK